MKDNTKKIERKCKEKNVNIFCRTIIQRNGKNCRINKLLGKKTKTKWKECKLKSYGRKRN